MSLLKVEALEKSFSGPDESVVVLDGVSFALEAGISVALRGESGSGKSTLLHLVAGLDNSNGGSILFEGRPIHALSLADRAALRREKISLVFQQFHLISTLISPGKTETK